MKNLKNKSILVKLIDLTIDDSLNWTYIGKTKDYYSFLSYENIVGDKYLIMEINIFEQPYLNKLKIYMQNYKEKQKIDCKVIDYSTKLKTLIFNVLKNIISYNDDGNFKEIYDDLIKIYRY